MLQSLRDIPRSIDRACRYDMSEQHLRHVLRSPSSWLALLFVTLTTKTSGNMGSLSTLEVVQPIVHVHVSLSLPLQFGNVPEQRAGLDH